MKKLLIVAGILTAFGTASAEVKIGGLVSYDFSKSSKTAYTVSPNSNSNINVGIAEKLGSGMGIKGYVELGVLGNGANAESNDVYLQVDSSVGSVKVGQVEAKNGIVGLGQGGAPVIGTDGTVLAGSSNLQSISYTTPSMYGLSFSVGNTRAIDNTGANKNAIGAAYTSGVFSAKVDRNQTTERVRASGAVTLKGVTLGAGVSRDELFKADSSVLGVSYTISGVSLGAAVSNGNGRGVEYGAQYALSKATSVNVAYATVENNSNVSSNVDTTRVRLSHAF